MRVDCPECGSPVFVDGPYENARCGACDSDVRVIDLWGDLMDRALSSEARGEEFQLASMLIAGTNVSVSHIAYATNRDTPPICTQCGELLDEVSRVPDGSSEDFYCPSCGTGHPTWPAPSYIPSHLRAKQVFLAPRENSEAPASAEANPARPILFGCMGCGAHLNVAVETPRVLTCEYCDADCYLPHEVWNRLHPVRKRRAFWIRLARN